MKTRRPTIPTQILSISMHMQSLVKFHQFVWGWGILFSGCPSFICSRYWAEVWSNSINLFYWAETKFWHQSRDITVINLQNLMRNNPNIDLVNINAYAKFGQNPSICSQDIERKWKIRTESRHHRMMDNLKTVYPIPILRMHGVQWFCKLFTSDICLHCVNLDSQLLCLRGPLEGGFSRITTLWSTLIQILSYHD